MACGTPVVAYNRGAAPEVVLHGQTGFIAHGFPDLLAGIAAVTDIDPDFLPSIRRLEFFLGWHDRSLSIFILFPTLYMTLGFREP